MMSLRFTRRFTKVPTTMALATCLCFALGADASSPELKTVAYTGQQAPDVETGVVFSSFNNPVINASGEIAFEAFLTGEGVGNLNANAVYKTVSGVLHEIARSNDQAPDAQEGVKFLFFRGPVLNDSGQVILSSAITGSAADIRNRDVIYSDTTGSLTVVVRETMPAPGADSGVLFREFGAPPAMSDLGHVAFLSSLTGTNVDSSNNEGIYSNVSGAFTEIAREGGQVPDADAGVVFQWFGTPISPPVDITTFASNAQGEIAFLARLTGVEVDTSNYLAIYSTPSGALSEFVRTGRQAPDAEHGVVFSFFDPPSLGASGHIAFSAGLSGPGVDAGGESAIYSDVSGVLSEVARTGYQAPDGESGVVLDSVGSPVLNASGQIVFRASLSDGDQAMYSAFEGELTNVARTGDQVPDAIEGVYFLHLHAPAINAAGQIAFAASLGGSGVEESSRSGLYATGLDGQLVKIIREGDYIDVNDDPGIEDLRMVADLEPVFDPGSGIGINNREHLDSRFNDLGQITFHAEFTDGTSGIFISNRVAVPEPGSLVILGLAGVGLLHRKRRA